MGFETTRFLRCVCCLFLWCFVSTTFGATPRLFDFHSGYWINLHHFLYWQALSAESPSEIHPIALNGADSEELHRLTVQERKQWSSAVSYYANNLTQRDLLFDEGMEAIKNQLEDSEASSICRTRRFRRI